MVLNPIEFDGKRQRVILHGSCEELRPLCEAACCRHHWIIGISLDEHASKLYESRSTCVLTSKACDKDLATCLYRYYELKKRPDGACVHLDNDNRCSIYPERPKVCRDNSCRGGWQLSSFSPPADRDPVTALKLEKEDFLERLTTDMIFIPHPLIRLHTVFIVHSKGEVSFLKEMIGRCGRFYTRDRFPYRQFDDALLLDFIQIFERKETLEVAYQHFCDNNGISLTKSEFFEIVWLLNKHNIVLDVKNFRGMLSGMGGI